MHQAISQENSLLEASVTAKENMSKLFTSLLFCVDLMFIPFVQGNEDLRKEAVKIDANGVVEFLKTIGYEQYVEPFSDVDASGDTLFDFEDDDLVDLGIDSSIARLKIRVLFRRKLEGPSVLVQRFPVQKVVEFLDHLKVKGDKEKYKVNFEKNNIDGELLKGASKDVLNELGVVGIDKKVIKSKFETVISSCL